MSSNFHDIAESIVDEPEFCALLIVDGLISNRLLATYCISENFSCHKDQPGSVCDKVCTGRNHGKILLEMRCTIVHQDSCRILCKTGRKKKIKHWCKLVKYSEQSNEILGTIHSVQISPARVTQPWNHLNLWKENIENSFDWQHKEKVWEFFNSWVTFVHSYALLMPTRLFLVCVRFTYKCRLQRDAGQLMWKLRLPPSQTPVEAGSQTECRSDLIFLSLTKLWQGLLESWQ